MLTNYLLNSTFKAKYGHRNLYKSEEYNVLTIDKRNGHLIGRYQDGFQLSVLAVFRLSLRNKGGPG